MRIALLILPACLLVSAQARAAEVCSSTRTTYAYSQPELGRAVAWVNAEVDAHVSREQPLLPGKNIATPIPADASWLLVTVETDTCGSGEAAGARQNAASALPPSFAELPADTVVEVESCKAQTRTSWKYRSQDEAGWNVIAFGEQRVSQCPQARGRMPESR